MTAARLLVLAVAGSVVGVGAVAGAQAPLLQTCVPGGTTGTGAPIPGWALRQTSGNVTRTERSATLTGSFTMQLAQCHGSVPVSPIGPVYTLRDATATLERAVTGTTIVKSPVPVGGQAKTGGSAGVQVGGRELHASGAASAAAAANSAQLDQGYISLRAKGRLEVGLTGAVDDAFFVRDAELEVSGAQGGTILVKAGELSLYACAGRVSPNGQVDKDGVALSATLRCGAEELSNASVKVTPKRALSGQAQLNVPAYKLDATLALQGPDLVVSGQWKGKPRGFVPVPGVPGVELQVLAPIVRGTLSRKAASGVITSTVALVFDADRLELRTTARMPTGQPWASAYVDPQPSAISAKLTTLALPSLPAPADALRGARDACLSAADKVLDNKLTKGDEHAGARDACNGSNPPPPSNPSVPVSVRLEVSVVAS